MNLRSICCFIFACTFLSAGTRGDGINELPDCSESSVSDILESMVLVSTLDGRVTALNTHAKGEVIWSIDTGQAPLLSSSIHKLELSNNGHWVRMIPSLSGGLYKFNGLNIEMLPVKADHLLQSSSFLLSDGLVISGGRETRIYSVAVDTGEILYECSMKGCDNFRNVSGNAIVVQRHTQTVRAIDIHTGNERWNFSVGQHDLKVTSSGCDKTIDEHSHDFNIRAVIPEGLVYAVQRSGSENVLWQQKLPSPVVAVWKFDQGNLHSVDLFHDKTWSTFAGNAPNMAPTLYVGMHNKQLYIQESVSLINDARRFTHLIENELVKNLHLPWEPVPVSSTALRTITKQDVDEDLEDAPTTALSVLYASEYVNGNGFFLFNKNTGLVKSTNQCTPSDENNSSKTINDFQNSSETPIQIIVSLWYWWKEVLIISVTTAILVNVIVTQGVLQFVQDYNGKRTESEMNAQNLERKSTSEGSSSSSFEDSKTSEYSSRYLLDFEPIQCLGRGAFGVVFAARNKIDDCNYAIKRIALPNSLESRDKVLREVKALAKLDHPNIVRYFNAWMECPPSGWQEHHDFVILNMCRSDSGIPGHTPSDDRCIMTTNEDGVISSNESSIIHKEAGINSVTSKNVYEESDSFIVFENSHTSSTSNQVKHISLNLEDSSASAESFWKQSTEKRRNSWSKEQQEKDGFKRKFNVQHVPSRMYLYIQMQLCLKESLKEWLSQNVMNRDKLKMLQMFGQVVHAVEYIHLEGLIHRDLKPSNIFFSMNGQIKVGDFGLVTTMTKDMMEESSESNSGYNVCGKHTTKVGTELYMSPEQVQGLPYDYKVDIYSLGVILFELLYPFSTQMERCNVLSALRKNTFPESFKENYCDEFELLRLMLSHDPQSRPTTFGIRARPPLADSLSRNKEESTSADWHFALPTHSRTESKTHFANV